jgi:WD40 repeat protein
MWPRFVAGGRFLIALADMSRYELWDLESGEIPDAWPKDVRCAAAGADGRHMAVLLSTGEVRVYDLPSLAVRSSCWVRFEMPKWLRYGWMSLSQDGRQVVLIGSDETRARVYEAKSGRVLREIKIPRARVEQGLALSRSGGLLAVAHDRAISVYDLADGEQLSMLQGHLSEGIVAHFQPDGDLLASTSWDGTIRLWDPIRGRLILTLTGEFRQWIPGVPNFAVGRGTEMFVNEMPAGAEWRSIDYRMLGDRAGAALFGPARVSYSPDGQLLAMAVRPEGVRIVRVRDGAALAFLPIGVCDETLFMPGGDLLTFNHLGLCRWPAAWLGDGVLRLGPPRLLDSVIPFQNAIHAGLDTSADGRIIGVSSLFRRGATLLDLDRPWRRTLLAPHGSSFDVAISPDGRWACTGSRADSAEGRKVKVWDVSTGRVAVELPGGNARVAFSPDSRWLGVGGIDKYRFFRTGDWAAGGVVEHGEGMSYQPVSIHPSSRVAALVDRTRANVRLAEIPSGRILAGLSAPNISAIHSTTFSPDGRYLAVARADQRVDLWDLRLIYARLESLGLAEGVPNLFQGETEPGRAPIDRIEARGADSAGFRVMAAQFTLKQARDNLMLLCDRGLSDPYELVRRGNLWRQLGYWQFAVADYRAALARRGDFADTANELAWALASHPESGATGEALAWARRAVELARDSRAYRNTLGAVLYRAGRFSEAADELERNAAGDREGFGFDMVYLSMCRQRLGQHREAKIALDRTRDWMATMPRLNRAQAVEFDAVIREAESLLYEPLPPLPADVFAH